MAIKDLEEKTKDAKIIANYKRLLEKDRVDKTKFENWYSKENLTELLNRDKRLSKRRLEIKYPGYRMLTNKCLNIRPAFTVKVFVSTKISFFFYKL